MVCPLFGSSTAVKGKVVGLIIDITFTLSSSEKVIEPM